MNYKRNDYELIYMVRENDENSRDILFEKYLPIIKSLASEYYQKYDSYGYDYEDFVQEALVAFQKSLVSFDEAKDTLFYTFTVVCIRRSLLSFCRNITNSKKNISNNNLLSVDEYENVIEDVDSNISSITDILEVNKMVKEMIFDMSFENSCIFELRYNGFSYREIGILLDLPVSSVEFKNRAAKRKYENLIKKYFIEKTV